MIRTICKVTVSEPIQRTRTGLKDKGKFTALGYWFLPQVHCSWLETKIYILRTTVGVTAGAIASGLLLHIPLVVLKQSEWWVAVPLIKVYAFLYAYIIGDSWGNS